MQDEKDRADKMVELAPGIKMPKPGDREFGMSIDDITRRQQAMEEKKRSLRDGIKASAAFQGDWQREPPKAEKYPEQVPVIIATPRGAPFRIPRAYGGGQIECNKQVIVTARQLRMLMGFKHRGVIQMIVGDVLLAKPEELKNAAKGRATPETDAAAQAAAKAAADAAAQAGQKPGGAQ